MKKLYTFLLFYLLLLLYGSCSDTPYHLEIKLIPVKSGEKWGYVDREGHYVINPQFEEADFFREGLAK